MSNSQSDLGIWYAVDYGVAGDGLVDEQPRLFDALGAASRAGGGQVWLPPNAVVLVARPVVLPANVELVIPTSTTLLLAPGAAANVVTATGVSGVRISGGGTIDGSRGTNAAGSCVAFTTVTDARIEGITVKSAALHGVLLTDCDRVELRGVTATDNGTHGVALVGATLHAAIVGVRSYDNGRVAATGVGDGVNIAGTSSDTAVVGLIAYDTLGTGGRQGYGLREAAGSAVDRTTIAASALSTNARGAVSLVGPSSAIVGPTENLLTNPGFEILQRGVGPYTANLAYAHDRWQILLGGTSTISVADETAVVDVGSGHALRAAYVHGSAVSYLDQKLEQFAQLRGRTITFSIRDRKGAASSVRPYVNDSGTRTYGTTTATTGAYETLVVTATIGAAATSVSVGVELSVSDTVYLDNATLCVGVVPMPYAPLQPADDLVRCQRYYQEVGGLSTSEFVAMLQATTAVDAFGALGFPTEMALTPTGTVSAAADWAVFAANGAPIACTAVTLVPTRRGTRITVTVAAGLVAGNAAGFRANATANARIRLEANP